MEHTVEYWPDAGLFVTTLQPLGGVVLVAANTSGTSARNTILLIILTDEITFVGWSYFLEEGVGLLYSHWQRTPRVTIYRGGGGV